jgi:hypothetical protein
MLDWIPAGEPFQMLVNHDVQIPPEALAIHDSAEQCLVENEIHIAEPDGGDELPPRCCAQRIAPSRARCSRSSLRRIAEHGGGANLLEALQENEGLCGRSGAGFRTKRSTKQRLPCGCDRQGIQSFDLQRTSFSAAVDDLS